MPAHFAEVSPSRSISPEYRPLGAWEYFGYSLLFGLPIIGLILLIVFSFSGSNINRRNFARSYFCMLVLLAVVCAILFFTGALSSLIDMLAQRL